MSRKIERSMLRKQYDDFCRAWNSEKMIQRIIESDGKELPDGHAKLGKKPTFKMWLDAKRSGAFEQSAQQEDKSVQVGDTAWEE